MQFEDIYQEARKRLKAGQYGAVWVFAWPEVFGSTTGPNRGIGGQALTTFQVFAFEYEDVDTQEVRGTAWCAGGWKPWDREKDGMQWQ